VGTTTTVASATASSGVVVATDPKSGASVSKNSAVNLVVSAGPPVSVPSVTQQQLTQAEQALAAAGLGYDPHFVSSDQPVGTVLTQNPGAGQKVKAGTKVQLTVSGTQTSVTVPSVLGQSPSAAGANLKAANLNVGTQTSGCTGQYPSGVVTAQNPAPNQGGIKPNTPVNLVISNCVAVPGVVGQSAAAAQAAITSIGLNANSTVDPSCAGGATAGNVDNQNPAPNTLVGPSSTVNIAVCQPVTTTTSSTTTTTSSPGTSTTTSTTTSNVRHHG
jgi:serine/threonine-protein kinase